MIRDFLHALGGPTAVAKWLSKRAGKPVSRERVSMWATNDNVPFEWRAMMVRMANECTVSVPSEVTQGIIVQDMEPLQPEAAQ